MTTVIEKREGKEQKEVRVNITPSGEIDLSRLDYPAYLRTKKSLAHLEGQRTGLKLALGHLGKASDRIGSVYWETSDPSVVLRPGATLWEALRELQRGTSFMRLLLQRLDREIVWRKDQGYTSEELDGEPQKPCWP